MRPSPFQRMLNIFQGRWADLAPNLQDDILIELDNGIPPVMAVKTVFEKNDLRDKLKGWISDACLNAAEKGGVTFTSNLTGREYFLNKSFDPSSISLSERVTQLKFQDDVVSTIQANLNNGERFGKLVTDISKYTTEETLPKGLLELERSARRVIAGDTEEFQTFQQLLKKEKSIALRAIQDGNETPLKRSYLRVVNAAEKLKEQGLTKAVENAIDQKARSAAYRIAHSEVANAFDVAINTRAQSDEDCTGIQWILSSAENHCEECEELDGEIFPVDKVPDRPHPNCSCDKILYYGNEDELTDKKYGDTNDATIPKELILNDNED